MTQKHLVLDYDVYLRLTKRKREIGLSLRDIGNLILREALSQPRLLVNTVGDRLAELGLVDAEQFQNVLDLAVSEIRQAAENSHELMSPAEDGSLSAGSWKLLPVHRSSDDAFQIVEARARDARKKPIPLHVHEEDEYFHILGGHVLIVDEGQQVILGPEDCHKIPRGHVHNATPLDGSVYAMITFVPAGPLFSESVTREE